MPAPTIRIQRAYEAAGQGTQGPRYLVDRMWPRGVKKAALHLDGWLKDVAPSTELRQWFHGDQRGRWEQFQERYRKELYQRPEAWAPLLQALCQHGSVTLIYGAKDKQLNNAVVLRQFLLEQAVQKHEEAHAEEEQEEEQEEEEEGARHAGKRQHTGKVQHKPAAAKHLAAQNAGPPGDSSKRSGTRKRTHSAEE